MTTEKSSASEYSDSNSVIQIAQRQKIAMFAGFMRRGSPVITGIAI